MALNSAQASVLAKAGSLVGIPYRLDPLPDGVNNLDCSLYVLRVFKEVGLPFPNEIRTAEQTREMCLPISAWSAVQPGDLLFFQRTYDSGEAPGDDGLLATHVGISEGAG